MIATWIIATGTQANFDKASAVTTNAFGVEYDYGSVMHYSAGAFSKNGQPTIVAKVINFMHNFSTFPECREPKNRMDLTQSKVPKQRIKCLWLHPFGCFYSATGSRSNRVRIYLNQTDTCASSLRFHEWIWVVALRCGFCFRQTRCRRVSIELAVRI